MNGDPSKESGPASGDAPSPATKVGGVATGGVVGAALALAASKLIADPTLKDFLIGAAPVLAVVVSDAFSRVARIVRERNFEARTERSIARCDKWLRDPNITPERRAQIIAMREEHIMLLLNNSFLKVSTTQTITFTKAPVAG
jgi:hypothetical protein